MPQPRLQEISSRRGGDKNSPLHMIQMVLATALLILAAALLIMHYNMVGLLVLVVGCVLSLVNFRQR